MDIEKNTHECKATDVRKKMFEFFGVKNFEEYMIILEQIAWWYTFALTNDYKVTAIRQLTPLQEEELEPPINLIK